MSRHGDDDGDYDNWTLDMGRWEHNLKRATASKRGQKVLRELRDALHAMPERRLIADELATPDGAVCAVGAYIAHCRAKDTRTSMVEAAKALAAEDPESWDGYQLDDNGQWTKEVVCPGGSWRTSHCNEGPGLEYTREAAVGAGMVATLAERISYLNDESWAICTPEQRWQKALVWVGSQIVEPAS